MSAIFNLYLLFIHDLTNGVFEFSSGRFASSFSRETELFNSFPAARILIGYFELVTCHLTMKLSERATLRNA